jgi:type I restriction enzyme S subunit
MDCLGTDSKTFASTQSKPLSDVAGSDTYFADGDVLLAKITPCFENGKLGIASELTNGVGFGSSEYIVFRPDESLNNEWLYYYLSRESFREEGAAVMSGACGHKRVPKDFIESYPIPVPPLEEQRRIVGLLDEAFEGMATAKANAEQNLQNARALFSSHLNSVFSQKGDGWVEKRFDEVCVLQRGFDLPTHSRNPGKYPLVSSNGITDRIDLWKIRGPGVVTGRSGTIGKLHFVDEDFWPLNTALYIKEFHGNHERFIYYFLKQFDLGKFSSGAGVPTLNRNNVHGEKVTVPNSLDEQKEIVAKLDALSEETQRLAAIYERKVAALEELKKSLLHRAFNGEL